jgi:hypothetical protein
MAKVVKTKSTRRQKQNDVFPLDRENFIILGIGVLVIVIGYILLSGDTVESFRQLTVAPIFLLIGYCVIIPIGLMFRKKKKPEAPEAPPAVSPQ